jgi:hydrogenase small subunit
MAVNVQRRGRAHACRSYRPRARDLLHAIDALLQAGHSDPPETAMIETFYERLRMQGVTRRSFLKFCSLTAASLGLSPTQAQEMAKALQSKPRLPVIWLEGLECTCCSESFIRSAHPLTRDVVLSTISLDYHMTLSAAAGDQLRKNAHDTIEKYKGQYILAVEGNPPLGEDGMYCIYYGRPFVEVLKEYAKHAKAVIAWGSCASWGCVQAAKPNPTRAVPIDKVILDKPIIKVPGCPPIAEVMSGVVSYVAAFDRLPTLDRQGRPQMFYSQRIHDKCYRRPHFDAGQFVESWDDYGARAGYCLYKVGCKGPTTYNACSTTRWNEGVSFPIGSGHGCIGCSEDDFWDKGSFYDRLNTIKDFGVEANADKVGAVAAGVVGAAIVAHAAVSAIQRAASGKPKSKTTA